MAEKDVVVAGQIDRQPPNFLLLSESSLSFTEVSIHWLMPSQLLIQGLPDDRQLPLASASSRL
jgi:hypothetical protein